jgi:class 3 adenylate cyclase/CHASE2 domain-containing sensor protein
MGADQSSAAYEMGHVLFVDVVEYSLEPIDRQTELLRLLQKIVRETAEFQRAREKNELISLPTGDGMALVFLRDPLSPARCALDIATALQRHPELRVRMGIHTGPVQLHADIREQVNVVGVGINTAQRVMDCGDAGHILLSRNVAEVLEQLTDWRDCLHDLGVYEVKHGLKLQLYSLTKDSLGNRDVPRKLAASSGGTAAASKVQLAAWTEPSRKAVLVRRAILFLTVVVLACVIIVAFDDWLDRGLTSGETSGATANATFAFSGLYQRIVAAPRNPIPRYTVVVEIDPERDPGSVGLHNLCGQRKMMAALVRRIAAGMPSVIAIDKFFGTSACPGDVNADLIRAFSEVSAKLPLVVGQRISDGIYLEASLVDGMPNLQQAIVNIDQDSRKLPLAWQVYPSKSDMDRRNGLDWRDTLSLKVAEAYERGNFPTRHPRLAKLRNPPPQHPYISFLNMDQFQQFRFPAGYILCGREVKQGEDATACPAVPQALSPLSGKIVLIGEISKEEDEWSTVVGRISGSYLQANFIEALLDDRYYEDFPVMNYVLGALFLAALEAILLFFEESLLKKSIAIAALSLALLLILYVVITDFHRYVNPLPFIALSLLIRAVAAHLPYFREGARQTT